MEELERELAIRDDEQHLLERKATILEQKIIQTAEAKQLEHTNEVRLTGYTAAWTDMCSSGSFERHN